MVYASSLCGSVVEAYKYCTRYYAQHRGYECKYIKSAGRESYPRLKCDYKTVVAVAPVA